MKLLIKIITEDFKDSSDLCPVNEPLTKALKRLHINIYGVSKYNIYNKEFKSIGEFNYILWNEALIRRLIKLSEYDDIYFYLEINIKLSFHNWMIYYFYKLKSF